MSDAASEPGRPPSALQWRAGALGPLVLAGVSAVLFLFTWAMLDRGIDLTDEGYYLNSAATPELYPYNITQFGKLLHPLLLLVDHDVALMRVINFFSLLSCQLAVVLRSLEAVGERLTLSKVSRWVVVSAFVVSALLFYCIWLPTPNYNSLNVLGASLFASAAIGWQRGKGGTTDLADILIGGVGLAICALVKPSTGALLIPLVLLAGATSLKRTVLFTAGVGVASAAIVAAYLLIAIGSPEAIQQSYLGNLTLTGGMLGGGMNFDRYLWRSAPFPGESLHIGAVMLLSATLYLTLVGKPANATVRLCLQAAAFAGLVASCVWVQFFPDTWNRPVTWTTGLMATAFAACHAVRDRSAIDGTLLRLAAIMILIPFAVGFGSNTGMTRSAGQAAGIWTAGSILTVAALMRGEILRAAVWWVSVMAVVSTGVVLSWAQYFPQRQSAALWTQESRVAVRGGKHALRVDAASAAYFDRLAAAARRNGFTGRTPVIDLTGTSPVTIYMLGGNALGWAYLASGYPGSQNLLEKTLALSRKEDVKRAWLLVASDGLSPDALRSFGLAFPDDYELVGRAQPGVGGAEQTLWRPRPDGRSADGP
jgi:hypothetical protein